MSRGRSSLALRTRWTLARSEICPSPRPRSQQKPYVRREIGGRQGLVARKVEQGARCGEAPRRNKGEKWEPTGNATLCP